MYHDYKSGSLVKLEYDEAWASAVAKVSGGRIKAKKEHMGEEGVKEEGRGPRERRQALPHQGPPPLERTS